MKAAPAVRTPGVSWQHDHEGFQRQLAAGKATERALADMLIAAGLDARVTDVKRRADGSVASPVLDGKAGRDEGGDVYVGNHVLEVKGRDLTFYDQPMSFPYEDCLLGSKRRWETREVLPCTVVIVSTRTGSVLSVPFGTRDAWVAREQRDNVRDYTDVSYAAPRSYLRSFDELLVHLRGACRHA